MKKNTKKKNQQSNKSINVTYLFLNIYFYIDRISELEPTIYRTRGDHVNHYTSDAAVTWNVMVLSNYVRTYYNLCHIQTPFF
jgi:hypothetical protein